VVAPAPKKNSGLIGITADSHNDIWITEGNDGYVDRIDPATNKYRRFQVPTASPSLSAITLGPDGNLWFTETFAAKVGRITPAGVITEFALPPSSGPLDITAGPDGNLWYTDTFQYEIGKLTTAGVVTEYPVPSHTFPFFITAGPDGNLWFTEGGPRVAKITPGGTITEYSTGNASSTSGIAVGADGNLWFGESSLDRLGTITTAGVVSSHYIRGSHPEEVVNGGGNELFVSVDQGLASYNVRTHGFVVLGYPQGATPFGFMALGGDGNIWFTQGSTNDVAVYVRHILSVNPSSLQLKAGQQATLTATETGGLTTLGAISSNPAIASVAPAGSNTFTVTGVASGSCTITVMDHKKNTFPVPVTVQ